MSSEWVKLQVIENIELVTYEKATDFYVYIFTDACRSNNLGATVKLTGNLTSRTPSGLPVLNFGNHCLAGC